LEGGALSKTIAINYGADNAHDKYVVAVKFNRSVVGHVPGKLENNSFFASKSWW